MEVHDYSNIFLGMSYFLNASLLWLYLYQGSFNELYWSHFIVTEIWLLFFLSKIVFSKKCETQKFNGRGQILWILRISSEFQLIN